MPIRQMIRINEDKCDGCGLCVPACHEAAIQIIDGKARVMDERRCDGAGACLGECPRGAITIEEREAPEFDEQIASTPPAKIAATPAMCPGMQSRVIQPIAPTQSASSLEVPSELRQWPLQLHLVSPQAPFFKNRPLLIAADCVPLAYGAFHSKFLAGRAVVLACPKLDETSEYVTRLAQIIELNAPPEIVVVIMEVPCCRGLMQMAQLALRQAANTPSELRVVIMGLDGQIRSDDQISI